MNLFALLLVTLVFSAVSSQVSPAAFPFDSPASRQSARTNPSTVDPTNRSPAVGEPYQFRPRFTRAWSSFSCVLRVLILNLFLASGSPETPPLKRTARSAASDSSSMDRFADAGSVEDTIELSTGANSTGSSGFDNEVSMSKPNSESHSAASQDEDYTIQYYSSSGSGNESAGSGSDSDMLIGNESADSDSGSGMQQNDSSTSQAMDAGSAGVSALSIGLSASVAVIFVTAGSLI